MMTTAFVFSILFYVRVNFGECRSRQVTLLLPGAPTSREPPRIPLDHQPQLAGEDEVATAKRLLARVISRYPRG